MRLLYAHPSDEMNLAIRRGTGINGSIWTLEPVDEEEIEDYLQVGPYDAVLLESLTALKAMRRYSTAPVVVLSHNTSPTFREEVYLAGGDCVVTAPARADEVIAALHMLVARRADRPVRIIELGNLKIDMLESFASVEGKKVHLTGKEFSILACLASRPGVCFTKELILSHLYGGRDEPELKIVDVFICKLRRKLRDAGSTASLETIWGRGYSIHPEVVNFKFNAKPVKKGSCSDWILKILEEHPNGLAFKELCQRIPTKYATDLIRTMLSTQGIEGRVYNAGDKASALYKLTDKYREKLAEEGRLPLAFPK